MVPRLIPCSSGAPPAGHLSRGRHYSAAANWAPLSPFPPTGTPQLAAGWKWLEVVNWWGEWATSGQIWRVAATSAGLLVARTQTGARASSWRRPETAGEGRSCAAPSQWGPFLGSGVQSGACLLCIIRRWRRALQPPLGVRAGLHCALCTVRCSIASVLQ